MSEDDDDGVSEDIAKLEETYLEQVLADADKKLCCTNCPKFFPKLLHLM